MSVLDEILARYQALPEDKQAEIRAQVGKATEGRKFIPMPGPQTDAYFCQADVLLFGGSAGAGKSGLICGLALEEHKRSLIMRRSYIDLQGGGGLIEELLKLYGSRKGFNGSPPATLRTDDGRIITFGAATNAGDEKAYQGRARDLLALDEACYFLKSQVQFLMGWVRSEDPAQICRTVFATNPPTSAEGDWLVEWFRPWLDLTHHNPAEPGELRWFITDHEGNDVEVSGPDPIERGGETYIPKSRTFIPGKLADNIYLSDSGYKATLDALPEPLRSAMRDGNFMLARQDAEDQVIPTEWIRAAQSRWTPEPPQHAPMSAMGVDVAQGGADETVLACRYDNWLAPLESFPGVQTPTGSEVSGLIISRRKHGCVVIVDVGGGYGGSTVEHMRDNGIDVRPFNGASGSRQRTKDNMLRFVNKRAEAIWKFREALDPDENSDVALPPDSEMVADLTSYRYKVTTRGIQVLSKDEIKKGIGRSPDKGDAVVMAYSDGPTIRSHHREWKKFSKGQTAGAVEVNLGPRAKMMRRR